MCKCDVYSCAYMNVCSTKVKSASFGKKHRTLDIFRTELLVALLFSHTKGIVGLFVSEQHPDRLSGTLGMHHKHSRPSQSPAQPLCLPGSKSSAGLRQPGFRKTSGCPWMCLSG